MKGRVGGALLSVYTRGCQVSPRGHYRFFCGSALSFCCDSLVSPCPLSRATVSPPCGVPTADLLSITEHLESSDALFNKNVGQTVKDAIFLLLRYD